MASTAILNAQPPHARPSAIPLLPTSQRRAERDPFEYRARPFPLSMVLGCEEIKTALLLATVNPNMGGVCISGGRGTAKSVMAKGVVKIMPPIERVKGSAFNIDPTRPDQLDTFTQKMLEEAGQELSDLETEIIDCPFVQVFLPERWWGRAVRKNPDFPFFCSR